MEWKLELSLPVKSRQQENEFLIFYDDHLIVMLKGFCEKLYLIKVYSCDCKFDIFIWSRV